ncbi:MAG TPA: BldC family transcriptional regulator [Streptosporangiaceae bacterium]|nr:BldC family transcriptional regulator [Streptosporangiaceae bacterium]
MTRHNPAPEYEPLLKPGEVAWMLHVDPKTVTRWARRGQISAVWTPGGHRRYRESDVRALLRSGKPGTPEATS